MTKMPDELALMSPPERALQVLRRAYDDDTPVAILGQTRRRADGHFSVSRSAAADLVGRGLARSTRPRGRFLLLTPEGKARVGLGD
jgi:hypothetical protein